MMDYQLLKEKLLSMFQPEKLEVSNEEWGFFNETGKQISCVGYATNLTPEVIGAASQMGVDLLLTHHDSWEFVFGLKEVCNRLLLEAHMTHGFFHAPLDDADFGTSASLAKALGITVDHVDMPYLDIFYCGFMGNIQDTEFGEFEKRLSDILQEPVRSFRNNEKPIRRIAVATGGGNMTGEMRCAVQNGCDTYVTGEYVIYSQQYAKLHGMNLLVGSHTNTEILGVESMVKELCRGTDLKMIRVPESND